jgi:hypothetical protein
VSIPTLNELKAAWGLTDEQAATLEAKIQKKVDAAGGLAPDVSEIFSALRQAIQPSNIEFALLKAAGEIAGAVKTGKSVIVKGKHSASFA